MKLGLENALASMKIPTQNCLRKLSVQQLGITIILFKLRVLNNHPFLLDWRIIDTLVKNKGKSSNIETSLAKCNYAQKVPSLVLSATSEGNIFKPKHILKPNVPRVQ